MKLRIGDHLRHLRRIGTYKSSMKRMVAGFFTLALVAAPSTARNGATGTSAAEIDPDHEIAKRQLARKEGNPGAGLMVVE